MYLGLERELSLLGQENKCADAGHAGSVVWKIEMNRPIKFVLALLLLLSPASTPAGGDEVVVLYNSRVPESKALAEFYARKRSVPQQQILGFDMTDAEDMSRQDFRNDLQRPLAKKLEELKLWRTGRGELPGTNGTRVRVAKKVVESKDD